MRSKSDTKMDETGSTVTSLVDSTMTGFVEQSMSSVHNDDSSKPGSLDKSKSSDVTGDGEAKDGAKSKSSSQ